MGASNPLRSLRVRVIAAFLTALLTTLGAQAVLMWNQNDVGQNLTLVAKGYVPLSKVAATFERDLQRLENEVERLMNPNRVSTIRSTPPAIYTQAFSRNLDKGRDVVNTARELQPPEEELAILNLVETHLNQIQMAAEEYQSRATLYALHRPPSPQPSIPDQSATELTESAVPDSSVQSPTEQADSAAPDGSVQSLQQSRRKLGKEIFFLNTILDNRIQRLTFRTEQAQTNSIAIAAVLGFIAFLFGLVLIGAVILALRPIQRLSVQVQRLAEGDYSGHIAVSGSDEIATLALEFNKMIRAVKLRDQTLVQRADQLKTLSRYLSSVLNSMDESLVVVEQDEVTLANNAAHLLWGATQNASLPSPLRAALTSNKPARIQGPNGTVHDMRVGQFGERGFILLTADVTRQAQTQQQLVQSERLALVGKMLAQITHEVRNPLNAMSLNAELLSEELSLLDPKKKTESWSMLSIISSEIERLTQLSGHYLELARRPQAQLEVQDIAAVITEVCQLFQPEFKQKGVEMQLHFGELPMLAIDGSQMRQALLNIIRNGLEAGSTELSITAKDSEGQLEIHLQDNGPGMTSEQISQACDPFWSTKAKGTGLGLAITQQIIEDHGGHLRVHSKEGEGTTVVLAIPGNPGNVNASR